MALPYNVYEMDDSYCPGGYVHILYYKSRPEPEGSEFCDAYDVPLESLEDLDRDTLKAVKGRDQYGIADPAVIKRIETENEIRYLIVSADAVRAAFAALSAVEADG